MGKMCLEVNILTPNLCFFSVVTMILSKQVNEFEGFGFIIVLYFLFNNL